MSPKQRKVSWPVMIVLVLGLTAFAFTLVREPRSPKATGPKTLTSRKPGGPANATSATTEKLDAQVILLRPYGFEPAQITRRKGQFLLVVLNRSGAWEANYQLDRLGGNKLHEAKVPREKRDWHQVVDLTPGDYVLKETNHPSWICKITVTPQ